MRTDNYTTVYVDIALRIGGEKEAESVLRNYASALKNYLDSCVKKITGLTDLGLRRDIEEEIGFRVGQIKNPKRPPYICSAALVGSFVFTARHCIRDKDGNITSLRNLSYESSNENFSYQFNDKSDKLYATAYYSDGKRELYFDEFKASDDIVAISVSRTPITGNTIKLGNAKKGDALILTGKNINVGSLRSLNSDLGRRVERLKLSERFVFDDSPICIVAHIPKKGCFLHACQTDNQSSGSPIFIKTGNELLLVGIHNRGFGTKETSDCWADKFSDHTPNTAAMVENVVLP